MVSQMVQTQLNGASLGERLLLRQRKDKHEDGVDVVQALEVSQSRVRVQDVVREEGQASAELVQLCGRCA